MEELDRRDQSSNNNNNNQSSSSSSPAIPRHHRRRGEFEIDGDEKFECSARSCAAATIADCVALCCCPCAVVNFVAFALVRVPWAIGRRCLIAGKRKWKSKRSEIPARSEEGKSKGWWTEEGIMDISSSSSSESRDHDERVWSELCQLGHLGFGRVSFTGITICPQIKQSPN